MTMTLAAPRRTLVSLQFAVANWQTKLRTGLSIEEIGQLGEAIWRYMQSDPEGRQVLRCRRHKRRTEFLPITLRHGSSQLIATVLEYCPGSTALGDAHTGLPHEFAVTRGDWRDLKEVPLA